MQKIFFKNRKGVTLIELLVSLSLFSLVIIVVLSLFSMGISSQRKVLALQGVQENARFMLEFMAKEIRMGVITAATSSTLTLRRPDGEIINYAFSGQNIQRTSSSSSGPINSADISVSGGFMPAGSAAATVFSRKSRLRSVFKGKARKLRNKRGSTYKPRFRKEIWTCLKVVFMTKKNEEGSSLLITILIMAAILAIAMGISKLSLGEIKISREFPQSFVAYYAAESGIEQGLYADLVTANPKGTASDFSGSLNADTTYIVEFNGTSPSRTISSKGVYKDTSRAIELTY